MKTHPRSRLPLALAGILGLITMLRMPPAAQADDGFVGIGAGVSSSVAWDRHTYATIPRKTIYRFELALRGERVLARGSDGIRVTVTRFVRNGDGPIRHRVIWRYIERGERPRIVGEGIGPLGSILALGGTALTRFGMVARSKVEMVATAYTPSCNGCGGRTAIGLRAGPGIVAVDPRVIPLGTHLFIPGYGFALAGDTGSDIQGYRVDLGFASYDQALQFGRRTIIVYVLT